MQSVLLGAIVGDLSMSTSWERDLRERNTFSSQCNGKNQHVLFNMSHMRHVFKLRGRVIALASHPKGRMFDSHRAHQFSIHFAC